MKHRNIGITVQLKRSTQESLFAEVAFVADVYPGEQLMGGWFCGHTGGDGTREKSSAAQPAQGNHEEEEDDHRQGENDSHSPRFGIINDEGQTVDRSRLTEFLPGPSAIRCWLINVGRFIEKSAPSCI